MTRRTTPRFDGAIVAAGHGDRLKRGGIETPKPLVELCGEPLLGRQAAAMLDAGAQRVVAIVNSGTAAIIGARGLKMPRGLELSVRDTPNSMETLLALGDMLAPGTFLLATVDAVFAPGEMERFVGRARTALARAPSGAAFDGALGLVRWRGDRRPLFAAVNRDGAIEQLGDAETKLVTAGLYLLSTRIFDFAAEARQSGLNAMRRFLALLIARGVRFAGIEMGAAIDIDEPGDLDAARAMLQPASAQRSASARYR